MIAEGIIDADTPERALSITIAMGKPSVGSREAAMILAHEAGVRVQNLHKLPLAAYSESLILRYLEKVQLRYEGVPMSHIRGYRDFWKNRFEVCEDVLDPRPDTELLVETALTVSFTRVLDLGTGSGCILLSLLDERAGAEGVGVDISASALKVAERNSDKLGVSNRAQFQQGNWFEPVLGKFDLIVSNPPYIDAEAYRGLDVSVREFEPEIALSPGGDGLDAYRSIVPVAISHLSQSGWFMVEIGFDQGETVNDLFLKAGYQNVQVLKDINNKDRVVKGQMPPK